MKHREKLTGTQLHGRLNKAPFVWVVTEDHPYSRTLSLLLRRFYCHLLLHRHISPGSSTFLCVQYNKTWRFTRPKQILSMREAAKDRKAHAKGTGSTWAQRVSTKEGEQGCVAGKPEPLNFSMLVCFITNKTK